MPNCPGCGRVVTYAELPGHVRTCKWIWSETPARESHRNDRLAVQLQLLEERLADGGYPRGRTSGRDSPESAPPEDAVPYEPPGDGVTDDPPED